MYSYIAVTVKVARKSVIIDHKTFQPLPVMGQNDNYKEPVTIFFSRRILNALAKNGHIPVAVFSTYSE